MKSVEFVAINRGEEEKKVRKKMLIGDRPCFRPRGGALSLIRLDWKPLRRILLTRGALLCRSIFGHRESAHLSVHRPSIIS